MPRVPELLAPAGGLKQLQAAVNNGADAVYLGGARFNARGRAENFRMPQLRDAIGYAHERGVKIYITFNTLLKDRELADALEYAAGLYEIGADAVIVQDMGLARMISNHLPGLPLHLSTQGTVYNEWAVDLMKEFGFSRIVPARELTLEELRRFITACHDTSDGSPACEVEVFVHGALCMCYSGQCQMSRILGGGARSGNRGLCAQPCRLPYTDDKGRTSYFLSPKDLCLLDDIPALCEAGVDSFKIEGRLKSAEYVAVTTSIYRKYLDLYARDGEFRVDPEDRRDLTQIFCRGGFTFGYLYGNPGEEILSGESPKNTGIYVGRVRSVVSPKSKGPDRKAAEGAARKGAVLVDAELTEPLREGDGVEIRPGRSRRAGSGAWEKPAGGVVTFCRSLAGSAVRIGDMKGRIETGDQIFRVTDGALLERARQSFEASDPQDLDRRMARRIPAVMEFTGYVGSPAVLKIREKSPAGYDEREETFCVEEVSSSAVEHAENRPADPQRIRAQLGKLGGTPFTVSEEDIHIRLGDDCAIPVSEINRMRRDSIRRLLEEKRKVRRDVPDDEAIRRAIRELKDSRLQPEEPLRQDLVPLEEFMEGADGLPYLFTISKGCQDAYIKEHFDEIVRRVGPGGIVVNNPGWIRRFLDAGVTVWGGHGLNVYNQQAMEAFARVGVRVIEASHETGESLNGRIPLMITEHPIQSKTLTDRKGQVHDVQLAPSGDKTIIW